MTGANLDLPAIFNEAIALTSGEARGQYLDEACGSDALLRKRVEALLHAHSEAGGFFGGKNPADVATDIGSVPELAGDTIGSYKLLQQIGEGGFGVVYMAEQEEPVRRRVALKLIKPGMDSREVIARFEAERQALALMDHPNIARVLDAGATDSGRPYFVMELVKGTTITEYCDQNDLNPSQRLELFLSVCRAVQHAHQKGVIHRDIKPSNVMITLHDGQPVVKVIDFGVAKAINQRLTEKTMFTNYGQMVGTPTYMSPEQAEMSGLDVDTRTDIYSLGVLLYELLTGTTPFDRKRLRTAGYDEIRRIIREEEPPKPSLRLSTLTETMSSVATHRQMEPRKLSLLLRGDLDWIVMKSLEKDRTRRYETANGLGRDIERFLNQEPVEATPPSARYRFRKFARRNKVAIGTATVVSVAVILGLIGTTWQAIRATRAEAIAEQNLEVADENFQRARQAVDKYFTTISDNELFDEAGMQPLRKELLEAALVYYEGFAEQQTDDPAVLGELAGVHARIALIYSATGSTAWPAAYARSLDIVERLHREGLDPAIWAGGLANSFRYHDGDTPQFAPESASRVYQRGIDLYGQLVEAHPDVVAFQEQLAVNHLVAAVIQDAIGQVEAAITNHQQALRIWEQLARTSSARRQYASPMSMGWNNMHFTLRNAGRGHELAAMHREAIATLRELYGNENAELAGMLYRAGFWLHKEGGSHDGESMLREALQICDKVLEKKAKTPRSLEHVRNLKGRAHWTLGTLLSETGRASEATEQRGKACRIWGVLASQHPARYRDEFHGRIRLHADLLQKVGRLDEAEKYYREALDVSQSLIADDPNNADYRKSAAIADLWFAERYTEQARMQEAGESYRRAALNYSRAAKTAGEQNRHAWNLAIHPYARHPRRRIEDLQPVVDLARRAVFRRRESAGGWNTLGVAQYRAGKFAAAVNALNKSVQLNNGTPFSVDAFFLAMSHWQAGHRDKALQWYRHAERWIRTRAPKDKQLISFRAEAADVLDLKHAPVEAERPGDDPRLALCSFIIEVLPETTWAHLQRGRILARCGESQQAEAGIRRALELANQAVAENDLPPHRLTRAQIHAELEQWDQAAADYAIVIDQHSDSKHSFSPRKQICRCVVEHPELFQRVVALRPRESALWIARGQHLAAREQWAEAAAAYRRAGTSREPTDSTTAYAGALLLAGDEQAYSEVCQALTGAATPQHQFANYIKTRTWCLRPVKDSDAERIENVARSFATMNAHRSFAVALAYYRVGQFELAIQLAEQSNSQDWYELADAMNWLVLAMAHQRLNHPDEARVWYEKSERLVVEGIANGTARAMWPGDWITLHLLRREAKELLQVANDETNRRSSPCETKLSRTIT